MAQPTARTGLAYALLNVPLTAKNPVIAPKREPWKVFSVALSAIRHQHKKAGVPDGTGFDAGMLQAWAKLDKGLIALIPVYKDLGIADAAAFDTLTLLGGIWQIRAETSAYGPAMANRISAFQSQGVNFIIRASMPELNNEAAARRLGVALGILYGTGASENLPDYESRIDYWRCFYRDIFEKTEVLGILHIDDASGKPVFNLAPAVTAPTQ